MLIGNRHDSAVDDVMDYCQGCDKEIYYGEDYLDFDGDLIHTETNCIVQYIKEHSIQKVASK